MAKPTKTTTPPVTTIDLAAFLADLDKSNDGMLDGDTAFTKKQVEDALRGHAQLNINGSPPSFMIKFCRARAAECRRKAEQATDPSQQRSWRKMEGRWFFLARSYANERHTDIISLRAS
jgi:hypothetical protein